MTSVGLVLGAGGIVGAAYHAGVLTALAEAGFDIRDAELIVGTSAGSGVAASLRAGFPPLDLAPRTFGQPISADAAAIVERSGGPPTIRFRPRPFSRLPVPSSPRLLFRAGRRPATALAGLLPTGTISTDEIGERVNALYGESSWPDRPLWICAVDLDRGDRVVFGRDDIDASVGVAVAASSSIPGFFQPVRHDGRRYVDGGVHSPTNADLLANAEFDLVVIISPMSATAASLMTTIPSARPMHARRLASEVKRIREAGTEVLTFQPTPADVTAMGRNPMDAKRRGPTTETALDAARARLTDPQVAARLKVLRDASTTPFDR